MSDSQSLTKAQARRLFLHQQGLLKRAPFGKGKPGTLAAIKQLSYVQIDTISVIERAHHHTLLLRVPDYKRLFLQELLAKDKQIFEYWSHAAAYLPMEDYRFARFRMHQVASQKKGHWFPRNHKVVRYVKDRISAEGPLMSKDFKLPEQGKSEPWWGWKPTKMALEQLFHEGKLMVHHRHNFQKVYDLTERVLPPNILTDVPTEEEFCEYLLHRSLTAFGFAKESEIRYLRKNLQNPLKKLLKQKEEEGEILRIQIDGIEGHFYTLRELIASYSDRLPRKKVFLLCPFDNAIIQRKRIIELFGFDYKLECYVPAAKRKYGYFSLAILFGDQFAGHLDMKIDRHTKRLLLQQLTIEPRFNLTDNFIKAFAESLVGYAKYNESSIIELSKLPHALQSRLKPYCQDFS